MAELHRPARPTSQAGRALVDSRAFHEQGLDPRDYSKYCADAGDGRIEVKVSPAALEFLEQVPATRQDREIVRALPFTKANSGRLTGTCDAMRVAAARSFSASAGLFGLLKL